MAEYFQVWKGDIAAQQWVDTCKPISTILDAKQWQHRSLSKTHSINCGNGLNWICIHIYIYTLVIHILSYDIYIYIKITRWIDRCQVEAWHFELVGASGPRP